MMKKNILLLLLIFSVLFFSGFFNVAYAGDQAIGDACCKDDDCAPVAGKTITCGCNPSATDCSITTGASGNEKITGKFGRCMDKNDPNTIVLCPTGRASIEEIIQSIINYIFYISLIVIPLIILYAAFLIMTAGGEPERVRKGRAIIIMASIGLAVILSAKVFYGILIDIIRG